MKFCTKCGTQMEDDVNFCPKCGTASNQVVNVESKTEVSEKDSSSLVAKLNEMHSYFSEIKEAYNIFDNGIGIISDDEWRKTVNKKIKTSIVFLIISLVIVLFFGIFAIISAIEDDWDNIAITILCGGWILIIFGLVSLIVGLIYLIKYSNHKKALEFYDKNVPIAQKQIQEHYAKLENCPLGINYTSPAVIKRLIYYIDSRRADSIKEAINLLEDERHKANVENTLAATRKAAEDAAFAAQMTAINTSW